MMYDYFTAEVVERNEVPITLQPACSDVIHFSCFLFVKTLWKCSAHSRTAVHSHHDREWKVPSNPSPADECSHCDHKD